ncbi:hypothetical protein Rhe02_70070 [Rhizocola hellebori]|uniref:DUF2975 domain-containing protein n=2 Tax=Rhizocola hellebori TaxID=1392758 RepID=A0A8J3QDT8_9ACTN|nr:hypothetical protein Rhe02_70070 [Rhizocola hellebori]
MLVLIVLVGTSLATAIGVWQLIVAAPIHTTVFVDADAAWPVEGVSADQSGEVGVEIRSPTGRQRLLYGLTKAPTAFLLLAVLAMLAALLRRARRTDPFTPHTVRSLRLMGAALATGVVAVAVQGAAQLLLSETITPKRIAAVMDVPFGWLLGGFVCFAIAEVINRGCAMRDELATVI